MISFYSKPYYTWEILTSFLSLLFVLQDGQTALMLASQNGHTEIVMDLIQAKVSPDLQSQVNRYPKLSWLLKSHLHHTFLLHKHLWYHFTHKRKTGSETYCNFPAILYLLLFIWNGGWNALRVRTVAKRHMRSSMFTASFILVSCVKLP